MTDDHLAVLAHEFSAGEGSFLEQMYNLRWDKEAFTRLINAMVTCCQTLTTGERRQADASDELDWTPVPRWLADGFWYVSADVRDFTRQSPWKATIAQEPDYFERAYECLYLLAYWFFTGDRPDIGACQELASDGEGRTR